MIMRYPIKVKQVIAAGVFDATIMLGLGVSIEKRVRLGAVTPEDEDEDKALHAWIVLCGGKTCWLDIEGSQTFNPINAVDMLIPARNGPVDCCEAHENKNWLRMSSYGLLLPDSDYDIDTIKAHLNGKA